MQGARMIDPSDMRREVLIHNLAKAGVKLASLATRVILLRVEQRKGLKN